MPLSKAKNRARMREARLHNKEGGGLVQPKTVKILHNGRYQDIVIPDIDADGNIIPGDTI